MPIIKVSNNKPTLPKFIKVTTSSGDIKVFPIKK
jgi:hypothetical protein